MIAVPFVMSSVLMVRDNFAILPVLVQEGEIFQNMPDYEHISVKEATEDGKKHVHVKWTPKFQ